jgi:3-hydroxyisobutyrate dehydrogenase-like beta-hydroxyacid dehydrogenase
MSDIKVGYIGLGNQGAPMAKRLAQWPGGLIVFDVRTEAMTPLAELGATLADSVADVAAADVISVTVLNDEQVRDVVGQLAEHAKPGTVIAIHSTIEPDTARELADQLKPKGIEVVDAPVSGGAGAADKGELAVMVGAEDDAYDKVKPVFKQWASMVVRAGEPGAGTRMKLARNMLTFIGFAAACEAQRLAEAAGIDLQKLGRVVRHSDAQSGGPGAIMARDDTKPLTPDHFLYNMFVHTRGLAEKDLKLALGLGAATGVELPLAEIALRDIAIIGGQETLHGRVARQGLGEDERGLRLGNAQYRRGSVLRSDRRSPVRHHLVQAGVVHAREAPDDPVCGNRRRLSGLGGDPGQRRVAQRGIHRGRAQGHRHLPDPIPGLPTGLRAQRNRVESCRQAPQGR